MGEQTATDTAARVEIIERATRHTFADRELVLRAITHPSAVQDAPRDSYERLEFLGDSVLGVIVAEEVYRRFPELPEGGLTRIRISIVAGTVLAQVARDAGLEAALVLGESELRSGRRGLLSALENAYEAITGALYLDGGLEVARDWVLRTLGPLISGDAALAPENPKSVLQEILQARGDSPVYRITGQEGPPHERCFTAAVFLGEELLGEGGGRSKREAEAAAALAALAHLES